RSRGHADAAGGRGGRCGRQGGARDRGRVGGPRRWRPRPLPEGPSPGGVRGSGDAHGRRPEGRPLPLLRRTSKQPSERERAVRAIREKQEKREKRAGGFLKCSYARTPVHGATPVRGADARRANQPLRRRRPRRAVPDVPGGAVVAAGRRRLGLWALPRAARSGARGRGGGIGRWREWTWSGASCADGISRTARPSGTASWGFGRAAGHAPSASMSNAGSTTALRGADGGRGRKCWRG